MAALTFFAARDDCPGQQTDWRERRTVRQTQRNTAGRAKNYGTSTPKMTDLNADGKFLKRFNTREAKGKVFRVGFGGGGLSLSKTTFDKREGATSDEQLTSALLSDLCIAKPSSRSLTPAMFRM